MAPSRATRGCDIAADEVFVSDGSKCDTGNILDILGPSPKVAVCDPVYPVYVDTNVMAGHTGWPDKEGRYDGLTYLPMTADNGFEPPLPTEPVDVVYLCYPNNPTGAVASRETLQQWVDWCNAHDALLLFDAAYAAFIRSKDTPRSIYELEGARRCAIEFRSLSKNAGFTGVRCAFTIVPKELTAKGPDGVDTPLHALWSRRQSTKFNGVSYITQRGAAAVYSEDGQAQVAKLVEHYMGNADLIRESLTAAGHTVHGGQHAPYVWVATPEGIDSWGFFDQLLEQHHVVGTPGAGFGASGEGYLRLSAFNSREAVEEAMQRLTGSPAAA
jgi:LL-diaminopimelate aminotransferase